LFVEDRWGFRSCHLEGGSWLSDNIVSPRLCEYKLTVLQYDLMDAKDPELIKVSKLRDVVAAEF